MLASLITYLCLVITTWFAFVAGIFLGVIGLLDFFAPDYNRWLNEHLSIDMRWKILAIALILSFISAGIKQQEQIKSLQKSIENLQRSPKLSVIFNQVMYGGHYKGDGNNPFTPLENCLVVQATIINSGNIPTIVRGWELTATFDNNQEIKAAPFVFPETAVFTNSTNTMEVTLYGSDSLQDQGLKALTEGDKIRGNLLYSLPGVPPQLIRNHLVKITLTVKDSQSKLHSSSFALGGGGTQEIMKIPGIKSDAKFLKP